MKKLLYILLFTCLNVYGTNYYVKTGGDDGKDGKSDANAWATITKVNTVWAAGTFAPGDNILFNRGNTFYGTLTVAEAGASGNHITVGAYGTGAKPVITGLETIDSWTDYGGGIYYHVLDEAPTIDLEMLLVDGEQKNMGRYPNLGRWNNWEKATNTTYIIDYDLDETDWTGAELFLIKNEGLSKICTITSQSGDTLRWTPNDGMSYGTLSNKRYFIQEHFATLDSLHEWYYDKEDTLFMYFGEATPGDYTVQAAVLTQLAVHTSNYKSYITFDNLHFYGANRYGAYAYYDNYWYFQNCTVQFIGDRGFYIRASDNCRLDSCHISYVNDIGLHSTSGSDYTVVNADTFQNVGMFLGHGVNGIYGAATLNQGKAQVAQYNYLHRIGRKGIAVSPEGATVQYNVIDTFEYHLRDGGGIYVGVGNLGNYDTVTITDNIILHGIGGDQYLNEAFGIYVDLGMIYGVEILRNTVAYCSGAGLKLSNVQHVNIHDNLFYANGANNYLTGGQLKIQSGAVLPGESETKLSDIDMSRNYMIAKGSTDMAVWCRTDSYYHDEFGNIDSNYYARPVSDNEIIRTYVGGVIDYKTLAEWVTYTTLDSNTNSSPITVEDTSKIKFYYNPTNSDSTFTLADDLLTMDNVKFTGDTIISAWGSAIFLVDPDPVVDPPDMPTVTTDTAYYTMATIIVATGTASDDGGGTISAKGICYATHNLPTTSDSKNDNGAGEGAISYTITGLAPNTTYYLRAYATNEIGTSYGYEYVIVTPKFMVVKHGGKYIVRYNKRVIIR